MGGRRDGVEPTRVLAVFRSRHTWLGAPAPARVAAEATFADVPTFMRALVKVQMTSYLGSLRGRF